MHNLFQVTDKTRKALKTSKNASSAFILFQHFLLFCSFESGSCYNNGTATALSEGYTGAKKKEKKITSSSTFVNLFGLLSTLVTAECERNTNLKLFHFRNLNIFYTFCEIATIKESFRNHLGTDQSVYQKVLCRTSK